MKSIVATAVLALALTGAARADPAGEARSLYDRFVAAENASDFEAVLKAIDGGMRPVVDSTYPLADVQAALTRLDAAEQFGKVVLSVSEGR